MKKSIDGIPRTIFQLWLYAPLLFLIYIDWITITSIGKLGFFAIIIFAASFFIARTVIFNEEFRQFDRATPFRILVFFGLAFAVAEVFVIVLSAFNENLQVTLGLITIPAIYAFIFTPLLVMRCEGWLPNPDKSQLDPKELSDPPSAVI